MGGLGYLSSTYNRIRLGSIPRRRIMAKRKWDSIDEEAERQGSAFKIQLTQISRVGWGKKIIKQRKMQKDADKRIECKLIKESYSR